MRVLDDKGQKLVEDNYKLIYYYLNKHRLDIDEWYDIMAISLCKSAIAYDSSIATFATFALHNMHNEYKMEMRNRHYSSRCQDVISLDQPMESGTENLCIGDMICGTENIEDNIITRTVINDCISRCSDRNRRIMSLAIDGKNTVEISGIVGLSQSYVSRIIIKIKKSLSASLA